MGSRCICTFLMIRCAPGCDNDAWAGGLDQTFFWKFWKRKYGKVRSFIPMFLEATCGDAQNEGLKHFSLQISLRHLHLLDFRSNLTMHQLQASGSDIWGKQWCGSQWDQGEGFGMARLYSYNLKVETFLADIRIAICRWVRFESKVDWELELAYNMII